MVDEGFVNRVPSINLAAGYQLVYSPALMIYVFLQATLEYVERNRNVTRVLEVRDCHTSV